MSQKFTIYTTAILYSEGERKMINSWEKLLISIIKCIPKKYNLILEHYDFIHKTNKTIINKRIRLLEQIDKKVCGDRLIKSSTNLNGLPNNLNVPKENVLIDMGHVISYSMKNYSEVNLPNHYYNKKYLQKFNYIYIAFDNFISSSFNNSKKLNDIKLFEVKKDGKIITIHYILDYFNILKMYSDGNEYLYQSLDKILMKEYDDNLRKTYNLGKGLFKDYQKYGLEYKTDYVSKLSFREKINYLWKKWDNLSKYKTQLLNIYPIL